MTLGPKLFLGMGFLIAVTVGVAGLGLFHLSAVQDSLGRYGGSAREIHLGTQANQSLLRIGQMEKNILLARNDAAREAFVREFQEYRNELNGLVEQLRESGSAATRQRLTLFKEHIDLYGSATSRLFTLIRDANLNEANTLSTGEIRELREAAEEIMRAVVDANDGRTGRRLRQERAQVNSVIWIMFLASVAGIVIATAVYVALVVFNVRPEFLNAIRSVTDSSERIGGTVDRQSQISSQQAVSVTEIFATIEELNATARQSSEQAESAAMMAERTRDLAIGGQRNVGEMQSSMDALKRGVHDTDRHFQELGEQIDRIGEITGLVSDFANDTKMLAMNAAVEAARAGEFGKGFSVLAIEIRNLAEESKKSAERISGLVAEIQHVTHKTKQVTLESASSVERGIQLVQEAAATFSQVSESVITGTENTQQISLNLQQQATAIRQVGEVMLTLRDGAKATAEGAESIRSGLESMKSATRDLSRMV